MELSSSWCGRGLFLMLALFTCNALACNPAQDGCMGCNDDELSICLQTFVEGLCNASGNPARCDAQRAYDDAERHVLISTGSHMSRIRSMMRTPRKYQRH